MHTSVSPCNFGSLALTWYVMCACAIKIYTWPTKGFTPNTSCA